LREVAAPASTPSCSRLQAGIEQVKGDADFTGTLRALTERDKEILDRLARVRYLTLAEALTIAEAVTGRE
jgi:hypothetical protein